MVPFRALRSFLPVVGPWALAVAACGHEAPAPSDVIRIASLDTVVTTESAFLAGPADLAVSASGRVFVADYRASVVVAVDPEERRVTVIGGPGEGPGEFDGVWAVRPLDTGVLVVDRGNGRIQHLDEEGGFQGQRPAPPGVQANMPYLRADGSVVIGSMGGDTALAREYDPEGAFLRKIGTSVTIMPPIADFRSIKARIARGEIPDEIRNSVYLTSQEDGHLWMALLSEGQVHRYDPEGTLEWSVTLEEPEFPSTLERFFQANAAMEAPMSFVTLRYFADIEAVGDRGWVLLATEPGGDAVVVVVGPDGTRERRIEISGAGGATHLAIDEGRGRIWLITSDDAQLLRAELPPG